MPGYYTNTGVSKSVLAWDITDRIKVRSMCRNGKSDDFIHRYTGMPMDEIRRQRKIQQREDKARFDGDSNRGHYKNYYIDSNNTPEPSDEASWARDARESNIRYLKALNKFFNKQKRENKNANANPCFGN